MSLVNQIHVVTVVGEGTSENCLEVEEIREI